jgi:hypothetical protein
MNKKLEQLLMWYLPILIVSRISKSLLIPYVTSMSRGEDWSMSSYHSLMYVLAITAALEHIVGAVWVWKNVTREQKKVLWAAFALLTGLWGILFFLAVMIYERISTANSNRIEA